MKLIIQIPCFNEEKTLPLVLKDLPKKIQGIDTIEVLVVSDASTDQSVTVAKGLGVTHVLELPQHRGLATVFKAGLEKALELGADIIVNTDGDNQYPGRYIPELLKPIIEKKADMVIGCRDINAILHFSLAKKFLQKFGSKIVRRFSGTDIPDTTSGFRAYSQDAAMRINVFSNYTYTIETIIQAGRQNIAIAYIPITINEKLRESRLIKSIPQYLVKSTATILRIYLMYEPFRTFMKIGVTFYSLGFMVMLRFLYFHFTSHRSGHVQSLVLATILVSIATAAVLLGLVGDLISANRRLNEEILYRLKKQKFMK